MALKKNKIAVGAVAYFSPVQLSNLGLLPESALANNTELRPYLCLATSNDMSEWYAITSKPAPKRQKIESVWRSGGDYRWQEKDQFLNDLRQGIAANDSLFIQAAANEHDFSNGRPTVLPVAIPVILDKMQSVGGSLTL
jgi:hypothetical protein